MATSNQPTTSDDMSLVADAVERQQSQLNTDGISMTVARPTTLTTVSHCD